MKRLSRYLALAVALYGAAAFYMWHQQRAFLYRLAPVFIPAQSQMIPRGEDISLTAHDGTVLRGWRIPATRPGAVTYLYFHGNADGLNARTERFKLMSANGDGVLALSYRGYGGSGGQPTEANLHADALAAYQHLAREVPPEQVVIFGESLGTGVALKLAGAVKARAVVLDSPYLSVLNRAQHSYPWLPVSLLLEDTFRSDLFIRTVNVPIMILHGTLDWVIPPGDSQKLADLAPAGLVTRQLYPGEAHVVPYDAGPMRDVPDFLAALK
jgi:uncharacterized protein